MVGEYIRFTDEKEKLNFMKKYGLASKSMTTIPRLFYQTTKLFKLCNLLGYEKEYSSWCSMVIDYGNGPTCIHSDYLLDMQTLERRKGNSLKDYTDTFVVFDFETTGINLRACEIIQIGAVKYENGREVAVFDEYVRPENPIPSKITALTGITDLDVCTADEINVVLKKFIDFIGDSVLVGFNISSFDTTLLYDYSMLLYGLTISNDFIDLRYIAEAYFKKNGIKLPNSKQTTIAEYFGIDVSGAHRALNDCYITLGCYKNLFDIQPPADVSSVETAVNLITNDFEQIVYDMLQEIIEQQELPINSLYLASNISHAGEKKGQEINKSICVHEPDYPAGSHNVDRIGKNDTFALIEYKEYKTKENCYRLKIKDSLFTESDVPSDATTNKSDSLGGFTQIIFPLDSESIYEFLRRVVLKGLVAYESNSSFACCSRFNDCSDAKKCVHENKLYSKGCKYRVHLEAGRIFYGKNRNVD